MSIQRLGTCDSALLDPLGRSRPRLGLALKVMLGSVTSRLTGTSPLNAGWARVSVLSVLGVAGFLLKAWVVLVDSTICGNVPRVCNTPRISVVFEIFEKYASSHGAYSYRHGIAQRRNK